MYMLMLSELLIHAVMQINSPSARSQRTRMEQPRRLQRIVLTLPSATPVVEQAALRRRAKAAVDLVWQVMNWDPESPIHKKPEIKLDWDEATATHLVYLYNEIVEKFDGPPNDFFELVGRGKSVNDNPALRIASIDIGGGTTDLMIIEHEITDSDRTILPHQLFREGFRLAGDDILKQVIEALVLPAISESLTAHGVSYAGNLLTELFGGDREAMSQQERTLRGLFVSQVLRPAALALLSEYEKTDPRHPRPPVTLRLGDTFAPDRQPSSAVLSYLEEPVARKGGQDFKVGDVEFEMDPRVTEQVVRGVVGDMMLDLADVVRAYDCDILLLSGRPSRLPVIKQIIDIFPPVAPHRIVAMDGYEVGNWYAFSSSSFKIEDPKTTAAVRSDVMSCLRWRG